ncbi:MFS transporter [Legionella sp. D16C41]|uniref:MFS transporter n=1 Tax=Legionella sp. D16C41 TaxID=3402688 RepID=UPI003AF72B9C
MTRDQLNIVKLTALGGILEFYDFTIYALFAPYLSYHFFANTNVLISLINTFAVFALGYLARPIGGIVFGHLGDKFGRKRAFSLAVFLMALATLLIGCLPSYQTIGSIATLILILLRLLQGFSVGGEIPGAAIFIIEHVAKARHGFSIGFVFMSITLGNTLGAIVGLFLTTMLSENQMMAWGWRIPFILGFILGLISFIIRRKVIETPVFLKLQEQKKTQQIPLFNVLKMSRPALINGFLLSAVPASIISLFLYLPSYLTNFVGIKISYTYWLNLLSFLGFALMTVFAGWLSDYFSRQKLFLGATLSLIFLSYFLFYNLTAQGEIFLLPFLAGFVLLGGLINGSYVVLLVESFPPSLRYSGVGLSYSLGVALFGGIAPLGFTWLIQTFDCNEAPAFYLIGSAVFTFIAVINLSFKAKAKIIEAI